MVVLCWFYFFLARRILQQITRRAAANDGMYDAYVHTVYASGLKCNPYSRIHNVDRGKNFELFHVYVVVSVCLLGFSYFFGLSNFCRLPNTMCR